MNKKRRIKWELIVAILVSIYFLISVVGWLVGPATLKQTPSGVYEEKGFDFFIKIGTGPKEVADYLGV